MIKSSLEYLTCILFDFSHERDIQEALVFYFLYLLFEYYILIGIGILGFEDNSNIDFIPFLSVTPFLFCVILSVSFVLKKNLKDPFSICLVILTLFLTIIFPNIIGFYIGMIPVSILSTRENNSLKKEIQQMEQEKLEHEQWIEKQLLSEQITRMKQDERNKQNLGNDEK